MGWVGVRMLLDTLQCTGQTHDGGRTEDTNGAAVEKRRSVAGRRRMLLVLMLSSLVLGLLPVGGSAWELCLGPRAGGRGCLRAVLGAWMGRALWIQPPLM